MPSWPNYVASVDWSEGIMWIMQIIALTTWPAYAAYAAYTAYAAYAAKHTPIYRTIYVPTNLDSLLAKNTYKHQRSLDIYL